MSNGRLTRLAAHALHGRIGFRWLHWSPPPDDDAWADEREAHRVALPRCFVSRYPVAGVLSGGGVGCAAADAAGRQPHRGVGP